MGYTSWESTVCYAYRYNIVAVRTASRAVRTAAGPQLDRNRRDLKPSSQFLPGVGRFLNLVVSMTNLMCRSAKPQKRSARGPARPQPGTHALDSSDSLDGVRFLGYRIDPFDLARALGTGFSAVLSNFELKSGQQRSSSSQDEDTLREGLAGQPGHDTKDVLDSLF
ncbi:hypothetical protein THAOC_17023 [Thalassiosira oceanica]|uniref:Uncharacterized protein n=1 Tax=Thalassiosira oceanica TaxID=159749 RepID=K0SAR3_THAOC|nr:hypothetical protein THAOC_17023 [Thalassiosira oceanica]|eukprot:EJK62370.1 hypothetical protein THAOC_17023 [Thalassiosira oceanica]